MSDQPETIQTLLARKDYNKAVPLLRREVEKYPTNVRIRLQFSDALAGAGMFEEAIASYEETARYYEDTGLTVQAIAVQKKMEKLRDLVAKTTPVAEEPPEPAFKDPIPKTPLFEDLEIDERKALGDKMVLESFNEGDIVISEGEPGSSLYVIVRGEVKVHGKGPKGESIYLANLSDGDFFGEVSVLTGKPRTATITASQKSELLRLDKDKLDAVMDSHPHVRQVLQEFYRKRANHTVEAMVESLKKRN